MRQLPIGGLAGYNTDASTHRNWADNFGDFFAGDARSVANKRELIDGQVEANWWDRLMNKSTEELTNAKMKSLADELRRDPRVQNIIDKGGKVNVNDSQRSILNRNNELVKLDAAKENASLLLGDRYYEVADLNNSRAVNAKVKELQKAEAERVSNERGGSKYNAEQAEKRYEAEREYRRSQDENRRLDRILERQLSAENNKMQLQLEYARLGQADKFRVQDRKDQAIMALMSGLSNLGAGFAL